MKSLYTSFKNNQALRKWLPAILFAVILHLLIISIFLFNANNSAEPKEGSINDPYESSRVESGTSDKTNNNKLDEGSRRLRTITDSETSELKKIDAELNVDNERRIINEEQKRERDKVNLKESEKSQTTSVNESDNKVSKENKDNYSSNNSFKRNQEYVAGIDNINNRATYARTHNPNERLLLSRDIPSEYAKDFKIDKDYQQMANEVEQINEKISNEIQKIKEQKMNEIRARSIQEHTGNEQNVTENEQKKVLEDSKSQVNIEAETEDNQLNVNNNEVTSNEEIQISKPNSEGQADINPINIKGSDNSTSINEP